VEMRHLGEDSHLSSAGWRRVATDLLKNSRIWHGSTNPASASAHPALALPSSTVRLFQQGLPADWKAELSPEGRPFYYREGTQTSQWERPQPVDAPQQPTVSTVPIRSTTTSATPVRTAPNQSLKPPPTVPTRITTTSIASV